MTQREHTMLDAVSPEPMRRRGTLPACFKKIVAMLGVTVAAVGPAARADAPPLLLVAEELRVVREYRLPEPVGAVAIEAGKDSLKLTVSGRQVPLDVPSLLRMPSTRLKEAVLGLGVEQPTSLYLLIPCGFNAERTGPAGSIVVTIADGRVSTVQSGSCTRR